MSSSTLGRWIAVPVTIFDDPLFDGEPYTRLQAWLWLQAKAAWRDTRHRVGSTIFPVAVGSLFVTLRQLKEKWKWKSDTRVRTFLKQLERDGKISFQSDAGKTYISLCNLEAFQRADTAENVEGTQGERRENAQKTPITPDHKDSKKQRMREDDSDFDGFQVWFENYPGSAHDNREKAEAEWRKLTSDERRKVIDETPGFLEDAREIGRNYPISASKFLLRRHWERKRCKPQATPAGKHRLRQASATAVTLPSKTREEMLREYREQNAKSWEVPGRKLGRPTRFMEQYERMKEGQRCDPEHVVEPGVADQNSKLAEAA